MRGVDISKTLPHQYEKCMPEINDSRFDFDGKLPAIATRRISVDIDLGSYSERKHLVK
jgi:hypothetical protein